MALVRGETTAIEFPGLTRRFPIRLINPGVHLSQGRRYKVLVCMDTGNPAFEAIFQSNNGFDGQLYFKADEIAPFATAGEAIYLHVKGWA